jgi:chorismate mutase
MVMFCRGVRGATTTDSEASDDILTATRQLLALMIRVNEIQPEDVASAIFSATEDLNAEFPAMAARQLGWLDVPLICTHEINVPGSLTRCIRILLHWNTDKTQQQVSHVYIKEAVKLRPDLSKLPPVDFAELESWIAQQMAQFSSKD